jgi:HK97 family phage major capsid protein
MTIEGLRERKNTLIATARELAAKTDNLSENNAEIKRIMSDVDAVEERIEAVKRMGEMHPPAKEVKASDPWMEHGSVKATQVFSGGTSEANYKAYTFGRYLQAIAGNKKAASWLKDNGHIKANNETTESAGGYTVPVITSPDLIYLRERFGLARQYSRVYPMSTDSLLVPNQTGSTTVYHVGENTAITASDFVFDQVLLQTVKLAALNPVSRELSEDTIIDYASMAARDFAVKLAQQEDVDCFMGDGTATYGGITGVLQAVYKVEPTTKVNIASLVLADAGQASPNTFRPSLANYRTAVGKIPQYPGINPAWFMHKAFWYNYVAPLLDALSGNAIMDIQQAYGPNPTFYGYPVIFSQVMPTAIAVNTPYMVLGDLSLGTAFGDRRGVTIEMSTERGFIEDQYIYKATERFAFKAFDLGNSATPASGNQRPGSLIVVAGGAT